MRLESHYTHPAVTSAAFRHLDGSLGAVLFNVWEKLEIVAVRCPREEPRTFSMARKSSVSLLVKHPKE
ncbi:hypothetical protein AMQ83_08735 [Paenibacillus riograndensis]|nr:hypothetical protein AMQ83_08735 [Paenibacillus riograndensis]